MKIRWTWKKISEALTAKGYACSVDGRGYHGRVYLVSYPGGEIVTPFDTVEEVRDAFGFHEDNGEEV